jgi:D-alanyl-D-alanine carboxypeptidase/D-alanyl-D-alanine-endopeptidase (penicillin-binding protein 4)
MARFSLLTIVALFSSAASAAPATLTLEQFQARMKAHVASLPAQTKAVVQVETLGGRAPLYSHDADALVIPASNTKLVTTIAALEKLGAGHRFQTKVVRQGEDLVLVGNGDPYLVSERLYLLARDVARAGVKKVGAIRVNNDAFAGNYRGLMEWDESGEPFTAMVSATSLNFNSLEVHITPRAGSGKPDVEAGPVPHGYAKILNEVTQSSGRGRNITVKPVKKDGNVETFRVSGTIGKDAAPAIVYASVSLPESHIAHVFAALLRKEGVAVATDFGGMGAGTGPVVASQDGLALLELVRLFNTYSNNFMTEQVFLGMGAAGGPASMEKSRAAAIALLRRQAACKDATLENGSGLSWNTRISARCFTETLQASYGDFRVFADLLGSLPVGGQTGSLRTRFRRAGAGFEAAKVRAKTGTLWSKQVVTSLVGFTQTADGTPVAFALMENDQRNDPGLLSTLKDWEDKCVELVQQLKL